MLVVPEDFSRFKSRELNKNNNSAFVTLKSLDIFKFKKNEKL